MTVSVLSYSHWRNRPSYNSLKRKSRILRQKLSESLESPGNLRDGSQKLRPAKSARLPFTRRIWTSWTKSENYLRQKGIRNLSDSEGLRLACRTLSFDDRLLTTYEAMKMEDGRRRR